MHLRTLLSLSPLLLPLGCLDQAGGKAGQSETDGGRSEATVEVVDEIESSEVESSETAGPGETVTPAPVRCLEAEPSALDFGGRVIGRTTSLEVELISCGDAPVAIRAIDLPASAGASFALRRGALEGLGPDAPVVLAPGASVRFQVDYFAASVSPLDTDQHPIRDVATVSVTSDAPGLTIPVSGFGVMTMCPVPVMRVAEGDHAAPGTELHLDGSGSYSPLSEIVGWRWGVALPAGSTAGFAPSAGVVNPTFVPDVSGVYTLTLEVDDDAGEASCATASTVIRVARPDTLRVELTWTTPSDLDPASTEVSTGTDLDLHVAHPAAAGPFDFDRNGKLDPWFDTRYDLFWYNQTPNWGTSPTDSADPRLEIDDTVGAGPETAHLQAVPAQGCYPIGVHYWNDWGFGPSYATVRIYRDEALVLEADSPALEPSDFWHVTDVCWPAPIEPLTQAMRCAATRDVCVDDGDCRPDVACEPDIIRDALGSDWQPP